MYLHTLSGFKQFSQFAFTCITQILATHGEIRTVIYSYYAHVQETFMVINFINIHMCFLGRSGLQHRENELKKRVYRSNSIKDNNNSKVLCENLWIPVNDLVEKMKYEVVTLFFQVSVFVVYAERGGHLNDHCQMRDECSEVGYFCSRNFTCQCLTPFYIPNWNRRQCVGAIDQKCKYDEHCIEGAFCFQQRMCQCKDDFFPSVDKTMCLSDSAGRVPVLSTLLLLPLVLLMGLG